MMQHHLGINLGHERSVAIVRDGEIVVAIEQERLDRQKYSIGYMLQSVGVASQMQLPWESIRYCLDSCGIAIADIASITANMPGVDFAPDIARRVFPKDVADKVIALPSHHLAHAYSAFWPSGFDEAVVLAVDATGSTGADHRTESYTLYEGRGHTLTTLHSETVASHLAGISTLGFIYEYITRKAGFVTKMGNTQISHAEAGKLMGLAPFGGQQSQWNRWIHPVEGSYALSISPYDIFLEVAALEKRYDTGTGKPYLRPYLVDLAYKVQQELEQALLHIVDLALKQTGLRKLCIAGGVGLNSVANYQLLHHLQLEDIFIFPAAGDSGIAAGAALWAYATNGGNKRPKLTKATLGHAYSDRQINRDLQKFEADVTVVELSDDAMVDRTAQALAQGYIVARFEGGSEYGPRALGHRSILADPSFERMQDILNVRVKFREAFRPFAPVIPLEDVSQVFEMSVGAPFMLVVPPIRPEMRDKIPAVTHVDGTGRVQTVTEADNAYFYRICRKLVELRQGLPVLLNTSFNMAGQPIVETPLEAIQTFLETDIDYLALENFWIAKRHVKVQNYAEHLEKVKPSAIPCGLPAEQPSVLDLMAQLDRAMFWGDMTDCPWTEAELQTLSSLGARYKETSILFPDSPFERPLKTQLSEHVVLILDPLGQSFLADLSKLSQAKKSNLSTYTLPQTKLLLALLDRSEGWQERLRIAQRLTHRELEGQLHWAMEQLSQYNLQPELGDRPMLPTESPSDSNLLPLLPSEPDRIFAPFADANFSLRNSLSQFHNLLRKSDYRVELICDRLGIDALQALEITHFHYYDRYKLAHTDLDNLIRLFLLRVALPERSLLELFGINLFAILKELGLLIPRNDRWASRIDLFCIEGLYLATDHRYMLLDEDKISENPVMYIGSDSAGLVYTAPQYAAEQVLDLCSGSGIQGLVASRYARQVTAIDINPRAIRFARFNAQLNGIDNISFHEGSLYEPVRGRRFDTILANPPFVPSPNKNLGFRDGGETGEEILVQIVNGSAAHLTESGRLFIVSDLVNAKNYQSKLTDWWRGGATHQLVLCTADRDEILFSIPHSHAPFGQTLEHYNQELEKWLQNFQQANLTAVNFGYIFISCLPASQTSSYYCRTIHNPTTVIHQQVLAYFQQQTWLQSSERGNYFLSLASDLRFRVEEDLDGRDRKIELFSPVNPYFTTYQINEEVWHLLQTIHRIQPQWNAFVIPFNAGLIEDLICKGILHLSPERLTVKPDRKSETPLPKTQNMTITELSTKTTPTCLSSYL
ncbi:carbamoyltransferase C-terminal domain-containing protein [Pseudanabaena sp. 'Roaring Creek']|uniref:carbamoyltransferase C-terminal domain-containing protein n=1 Tax=Pseudanabaena sp. 'Roaring Creek' TaxID=1681830 RepID=UPI0006D788C6|nr:carbamoyltransferase C-terminal domain-containing protein [Pseudanabaena sp. 'Roaring Creek']